MVTINVGIKYSGSEPDTRLATWFPACWTLRGNKEKPRTHRAVFGDNCYHRETDRLIPTVTKSSQRWYCSHVRISHERASAHDGRLHAVRSTRRARHQTPHTFSHDPAGLSFRLAACLALHVQRYGEVEDLEGMLSCSVQTTHTQSRNGGGC